MLVYHKVDLQSEIGIGCVRPEKFRQQIEYLLKIGYEFTTLSELVANWENPKLIALAFDDGYKNIFTFAFPILREHGVPATVFLIANSVGGDNSWDVNLGGRKYRHLDVYEIQELVRNGWEMGSHSLSHQSLVGMPTDSIERELKLSKKIIEEKFNTPVRFFCAPFGKLNRKIIDLAKQAGYQNFCGFFPFKYYKQKPPPEIVMRLAVYSTDSLKAIERKLASNWLLKIEIIKQNVINFCANGTVIIQKLK